VRLLFASLNCVGSLHFYFLFLVFVCRLELCTCVCVYAVNTNTINNYHMFTLGSIKILACTMSCDNQQEEGE